MLGARIRRNRRSERGQIMVLGVLGVFLVALMMLLTLNLGQAIHEKIRIQQLADSAAFSMATQEARAFNFFAYTNRANISNLVAASSTHALMSMASSVPQMFRAAATNFRAFASQEMILCIACKFRCNHCRHMANDNRVERKYNSEASEWEGKLKRVVDEKFIDAIEALDDHMYYIAQNQAAMKSSILAQLQNEGITTELRDRFAPRAAESPGGIRALNASEFSAAFETKQEKKQWVPTEIGNGSRWARNILNQWFISDRGLLDIYLFIHPPTLMDFMFSDWPKPAKGISIPNNHEGQSRIIRGYSNPEQRINGDNAGPVGDTAASYDSGRVSSIAMQCPATMFPRTSGYQAWVSSSKSSGGHEPRAACAGAGNHKFKCLSDGSGCFTLFKAEPDPAKNFGQPVVYAVITQDLSKMERGGSGPWEVSSSGNVGMDLGGDVGRRSVQIADTEGGVGEGVAMSKAMAYYHLPRYPDGWKEHPNFFNPYWKAKLQPFRNATEAAEVLGAAGQSRYNAALLGAPLP